METALRQAIRANGPNVVSLRDSSLPDLKDLLDGVGKYSKEHGFKSAQNAAALAWMFLNSETSRVLVNASSVEAQMSQVKVAFLSDAAERKFILVREKPHDYSQFIDRDDLFGSDVQSGFPSATADIREAGNCLAVEIHTAAVFHLMRVAEFGLRALAHDRRVRFLKKGPLELATWDEIIRELEKAEQAIQNYPKTLARESQFDFYHGAMMEFKRFKNKFRNSVMHARNEYDADEAHSAFEHVRAFMLILVGKISETKRTPVVWKKP